MTYYRLAVQDRQTAKWIWQAATVTSLQAVFRLLRIYGMLPQGGTRVFTASSKEGLREMLRRQNSNLPSNSVAATQFLRERNLVGRERVQSASDQSISSQVVLPVANAATWAKDIWEQHLAMRTAQAAQPAETNATLDAALSMGISVLDKKRLEIELGPGGDHDNPYSFALPASMPQILAWMRLLARVQLGELVP